jgi:SAM-dependent methyltransferase
MTVWHEEDVFWETMRGSMFSERLWDLAPEQVDATIVLLELATGATVLDLPCGVGRHSLEFARRGYRVTGVDRTEAYLHTARTKADAEGLEVEWIQADMRQFVRPDAFDAVLNLFTSFGYFDDAAEDLRVAQNLLRCLKPGGVLLMEMMGKEVLARIFVPRDWQELPDGSILLQERTVRCDWSWMENRWILIKPNGTRHDYLVTHRLYDGSGLRALLLEAGFESVELYGGLEGTSYDVDAHRLVAVAHKPAS